MLVKHPIYEDKCLRKFEQREPQMEGELEECVPPTMPSVSGKPCLDHRWKPESQYLFSDAPLSHCRFAQPTHLSRVFIGGMHRFEGVAPFFEAIHHQIHFYNNHRVHTDLNMPPPDFAAQSFSGAYLISHTDFGWTEKQEVQRTAAKLTVILLHFVLSSSLAIYGYKGVSNHVNVRE